MGWEENDRQVLERIAAALEELVLVSAPVRIGGGEFTIPSPSAHICSPASLPGSVLPSSCVVCGKAMP